jgi:hypothetical protein
MANKISAQPTTLDLSLYAGDGFSTAFNFKDGLTGEPWPVTGTWVAEIRAKASDPDPLAEFAIDLTDAAEGIIRASLTGEQVRSLLDTTGGVWDLQQTPASGQPKTWFRGRISAQWDVSRS